MQKNTENIKNPFMMKSLQKIDLNVIPDTINLLEENKG